MARFLRSTARDIFRLPQRRHTVMTTSVTRRAPFRAKVNERQGLLVPGAFNAMSARVIEDAGFEAIYITGAGVTNMSLGLPDLGFIRLAGVSEDCARIRDAGE